MDANTRGVGSYREARPRSRNILLLGSELHDGCKTVIDIALTYVFEVDTKSTTFKIYMPTRRCLVTECHIGRLLRRRVSAVKGDGRAPLCGFELAIV